MHRHAKSSSRRSLATLIAALLLGTLTLVACSPMSSTSNTSNDPSSDEVADSGYVSGDGTVTIWTPDERNDPVELAGVTFGEQEVDLADWHGSVVVLNFWYAACPPCRAEAPDLNEVATEMADEDVEFLGINSTDDPGTAEAFDRTFEVPYPSLHDERSQGVAAMQGKVALQAVPTTVVLDTEGRVAARVIGRVDSSTLRTLITDIQAESD